MELETKWDQVKVQTLGNLSHASRQKVKAPGSLHLLMLQVPYCPAIYSVIY